MESTEESTSSDLLKIARAVGGDSSFNLRAEMALELSGLESSRANLIFIAKEVVEFIDCTVEGAVNTDRVTDQMIETAIGKIQPTE